MTTASPEVKTVSEESLIGAEIVVIKTHLPVHENCGRCGAQAYVEAEFGKDRLKLAFCAHHYSEHEEAVVLQARKIVDYRPYLERQTALFKGQVLA